MNMERKKKKLLWKKIINVSHKLRKYITLLNHTGFFFLQHLIHYSSEKSVSNKFVCNGKFPKTNIKDSYWDLCSMLSK